MSLATRCTACGTIFRVVQDQLRVSEGWVRCGRCAEVFDAREQLFDIDREAPPPWPAGASQAPVSGFGEPLLPPALQAPSPPAPTSSPASVWTSSPTPVSPPLTSPPAPQAAAPVYAPEPPHAVAAPTFESREVESEFDSQLHSRMEPQWVDEVHPHVDAEPASEAAAEGNVAQDFGTDTVLAPGLAETAAEPDKPPKVKKAKKAGKPATDSSSGPPAVPEFMRRAQMSERWRQPRVRIALGVCSALLAAVLAYQFTLQFHNAIVAVYPASQPTMQAFCEFSSCELQPWRRIDVIGVDASALNQAGPNNQYQLTVNLRNKSGLEVATPWVELSLTDAAGAVVARRMLGPTEFKGGKASMPPNAELPLQVLLSTGDQRVSGYSIEIVHP
jgi:predicted Zn finger-like uncharacterized protein